MDKITVTMDTLPEGVSQVREYLMSKKVNHRDAARAMLSVEEITAALLDKSPQGKAVIGLSSFIGNISIRITARGEKVVLTDIGQLYETDDEWDDEYNDAVRQLMNRVLGENISMSYTRNSNVCTISVAKSKYSGIINAVAALVLGIAAGLVLKEFMPDAVSAFINEYIFSSVSTMFMSGIKMVVGPLVFFSMAVSISGFSDLRALGRIAGKVICGYLCTSAIAIAIGYLVYSLFPIGNPALTAAMSDAAASTVSAGSGATVSIVDTIVGIVPSTFAGPFLDNDMLQIIFMGMLLGIGAGAASKKYSFVTDQLGSLDAIFTKITTVIIGFMPLAIFCSMGSMVINMDFGTLLNVVVWLPVSYIGDLGMICAYCLILLVVGRLNPLRFLKGFSTALLTAFSTNSSNATMPTSMKCCGSNLGVDRKVYSFSIPLGATINMDGSCISLVITTLFMARIFEVPVSGSELFSLFVMIMLLSVGAPGVPGGNLVCLVMILPQLGIPAEAISIIMGIYTLGAMGVTVVNVTGDAMITTLVAKSEKMLDTDIFNGKIRN